MLFWDSLVKMSEIEVDPILAISLKFLPGYHPVEWACLLQL